MIYNRHNTHNGYNTYNELQQGCCQCVSVVSVVSVVTLLLVMPDTGHKSLSVHPTRSNCLLSLLKDATVRQ
jgi:hypothetical protein